MTSHRNAYSRFQRAVLTGNVQFIEAAAAELPRIGLDGALVILSLLAGSGDPRFDRAAARWIGRLLTETPAGLQDAELRVRRQEVSSMSARADFPTGSPARRVISGVRERVG